MAKRGGSELNHDNWDREDDKEDAGNFQAATADEMKGRIIKRARRRNIGEGAEKKNAFASFGGFGGKPDIQASSFSFGPKSGSESSDKPSGFAGFGLSQTTEQKSVFGSPAASFGSSLETQKPKTPSFGTEAFSFGSKTPSGGGTGGGSAFSLSSGTSGFSFGSSGDKKETVFGASIKPLPTDPPPITPGNTEKDASPLRADFSSFKKPAGWSCSVCMINNPEDKTKCLACETAKPGSAPAPGLPTTNSFKFGATSAVTAPAKADTGAASMFAFGAAKTTSASDPPAGGFLFGSKTSASSQEPSPAFGLSTKSPSSSAFTFGEAKTPKEKDPEKDKKDLSGSSGFVFGKSNSPARTPSFSFNSEANKAESSKAVSLSSNSEDKPTESKSPASNSNSKPTSKHSPEYLSHLKALNNQVLAWLKMHIDSNPLVILSPVFKDYETHLEEISTKYGASPSSEEASDPAPQEKTIVVSKDKEQPQPPKVPSEPTKPFSFGSFSAAPTTSTAAASSLFSFSSSSAAAPAKVENPTSAFSFSVNSTPAPVSSFGAFSFGAGAGAGASAIAPVAQVAPASEDAGDDEDQPPVVEIKQVEETDALYSKKCKLFYKKDTKYIEKGLGMLYLKSVDGNKTQLLVRADTNLGNVLLNILLSSQMPTTRVGKNNVMIVCVPNPPIDPKNDSSEPWPMLLRVKTEEDANELLDKINELKDK